MNGRGRIRVGGRTGRIALPVEGNLPSLAGATGWLNTPPLTAESLRGKVVLIDFWTYSCINCLRSLPYVERWYDTYREHGLVVIGVHAPEFAFERDPDNVRRAVTDLGVHYPVAIDDNYALWRGFNNQYWPAHYFIDGSGGIRGHHFGEGSYAGSERLIRELLTQAGNEHLPPPVVASDDALLPASGVEAAADLDQDLSGETYVGYRRAAGFSSPGGFARDRTSAYGLPPSLRLNEWALGGTWDVDPEKAVLAGDAGQDRISVFRPRPAPGARARHRGQAGEIPRHHGRRRPGSSHGADIDADGLGEVREQSLYQLIRQSGPVGEHTFSIEFLGSGRAGLLVHLRLGATMKHARRDFVRAAASLALMQAAAGRRARPPPPRRRTSPSRIFPRKVGARARRTSPRS